MGSGRNQNSRHFVNTHSNPLDVILNSLAPNAAYIKARPSAEFPSHRPSRQRLRTTARHLNQPLQNPTCLPNAPATAPASADPAYHVYRLPLDSPSNTGAAVPRELAASAARDSATALNAPIRLIPTRCAMGSMMRLDGS